METLSSQPTTPILELPPPTPASYYLATTQTTNVSTHNPNSAPSPQYSDGMRSLHPTAGSNSGNNYHQMETMLRR